jgi:hypothetical protein
MRAQNPPSPTETKNISGNFSLFANESFFNLFIKLLQRKLVFIAPLVFVSGQVEQALTNLIQGEITQDSGATGWIWVAGFLALVNGIVAPTGILLIVGSIFTKWDRQTALAKFHELLKEQTRALGKILLWSLVLLLPGFYKFLQTLFIGPVVLLDPQYENNQSDALLQSRAVFLKYRFNTITFAACFYLLIPMATSFLQPWRSFSLTPFASMGLAVLDATLQSAAALFVFKFWINQRNSYVA